MNPTLTQISLNPKHEKTRVFLSHRETLHAAIAASQPEKERVLYRVTKLTSSAAPQLLILSATDFNTERILTQTQTSTSLVKSRSYQPVLDHIQIGNRYRFEVTLNPTVKVQRHRVPLTEPQLPEWFSRKSELHGFLVNPNGYTTTNPETLRFRKQGLKVQLNFWTFSGTLTVEDAELFRDTLIRGIGSGKAYGAGLLTISRV